MTDCADAPRTRIQELTGTSAARFGPTFALLFAVASIPLFAVAKLDAELVAAFYDFEVTVYCGMAGAEVQAGFERDARSIMERRGIDQTSMEAARMQAWKEAHLEWQNRGLIGIRAWCRSQGSATRTRFIGR